MGEVFDASRPIYAQSVERFQARILEGVYPPGGQLTSGRLRVVGGWFGGGFGGGGVVRWGRVGGAAAGGNANTMQRALAQLETEGLVRTERTSGRYVTEDIALIEQLRAAAAQQIAAEFLEKMNGIGYTPAQAAALLERWGRNGQQPGKETEQ